MKGDKVPVNVHLKNPKSSKRTENEVKSQYPSKGKILKSKDYCWKMLSIDSFTQKNRRPLVLASPPKLSSRNQWLEVKKTKKKAQAEICMIFLNTKGSL